MAGTLSYRIRVQHIYQQRFTEADKLGQALSGCRWYLISRRPAVRIVPGSAVLGDDVLTVDLTTWRPDRSTLTMQVGTDLTDLGPTWNFATYSDGAYFSFNAGDQLMHGDAWALASLLSNAQPELARQEVLYVGMALSQSTFARTDRHQKLQQIYADHIDGGWDIFVSALALDRHTWTGDDHIEDTEDGPDMGAINDFLAIKDGHVPKPAVDLIEHSLVSYFAPAYNHQLLQWRAAAPTDAMRTMREAGLRLLNVHLDGWAGLARYYSKQAPAFPRSHFICQDIPPHPRRPVLRGISTTKLSPHRLDAHAVRFGQDIFASRAEASGTVLAIFGDQAPSVRRPADFLAPAPTTPAAAAATAPCTPPQASTVTGLRKELLNQRAVRLRRDAPLVHPGGSSYDPTTGTIGVGEVGDGDQAEMLHWPLHTPAGQVEHGLILGESGKGKSNLLRLITYEAAASGVFFVAPADPRNENSVARTWSSLPDQSWVSTNVPDTVSNLARLTNVIRSRHDRQSYAQPTSEVPGILMAIDDADDVLEDPHAAACALEIVRAGHAVGVGLVLVIRDSRAFEAHRELGRLLLDANVSSMPDLTIVDDVRATCSEPRPATASEALATFVVHWDPGRIRLSRLVATMPTNSTDIADSPNADSPDAAREWAEHLLSSVEVRPLGWDTVDGDDRSWSSVDVAARQWFLRRHTDCWAMLRTLVDHPMPSPPTQLSAITWANTTIDAHFHVPSLRWHRGPTTGEPGVRALYTDAVDEPEPKPGVTQADLIQWLY